MCAMVPSMDFVLTVPLTDLSAATVMVPVPEADVVTGGVSCAPVKSTFRSAARADPLPMTNAADAISPRKLVKLMKDFMVNSKGLFRMSATGGAKRRPAQAINAAISAGQDLQLWCVRWSQRHTGSPKTSPP